MSKDFDESIKSLIDNNAFIKRRLSWVAQDEGFFYKIPRESGSLSSDIKNEKIAEKAEQEHKHLQLLNSLAPDMVEAPAHFSRKYSCTINRKIKGEDLRDVLLKLDQSSEVEEEVKKAIEKIAKLHRKTPGTEINSRDYSGIEILDKGLLEKINSQPRVINCVGLSVRNFRYNKDGDPFFFDPTRIYLGVPEDDLARFIFSLLILRWGRNHKSIIFTKFDPARLLKYYEEQAGIELDRDVFFVMMDLSIKSQKRSTTKKMKRSGIFSLPMYLYSRLFFYQINKWKSRNYEKLSRNNQGSL